MPPRLAFAVTETGPEAAAGDYFTALELGAALQERFGWQISYLPKGANWYDVEGIDLLVVLVDGYDLSAVRNASPQLFTIAWARNWFDRWCEHPWIADYDLHLASSRQAANFMSQRIGKRTRLLRIATNPERFNTDGRPAQPTLDYAFTGNFWQAERDIVHALTALPSYFHGAIHGKHWEQVSALAHLHRGFVPYDQIHEVYRQATIVIDDANHVTKSWGAANSRVFDALAAGCLVITNSRSVSDDTFEGRLPVYESPKALVNLLDRYLNDTDERNHLLNELRGMVLARHRYSHRAMELGLHLRLMQKRGSDLIATIPLRNTSGPAVPQKKTYQQGGTTAKDAPSVSFVIPLFNHLAQTRAMMASLHASLSPHLDYEIILVDDGSTDGTRDWLRDVRDNRIHILLNANNQGYAAAKNTGVRRAQGEVLGLLHNDMLFQPGWLEPLLEILHDAWANAGVVGNLRYRVGDHQLIHAGIQVTPLGQLAHIQRLPDTPPAYCVRFAVTGACMLLRKADFVAVGGFDEHHNNGCGDIDLCLKLRAQKKRVYVANGSSIRQHACRSLETNDKQNLRNSRWLFHRWRKVIKQTLSDIWHELLLSGPTAYAGMVSGKLTADFLATPRLASRMIAEAILRREEAQWSKDSAGETSSSNLASCLRVYGLHYRAGIPDLLLEKSAEFAIAGQNSISNFFICGYRIAEMKRTTLHILVNNVQKQSFVLPQEKNFNIGISYPLFFPCKSNQILLTTDHPIALTHAVINGHAIELDRVVERIQ